MVTCFLCFVSSVCHSAFVTIWMSFILPSCCQISIVHLQACLAPFLFCLSVLPVFVSLIGMHLCPPCVISKYVCLSAFPSLVCSSAIHFVSNSPHDRFFFRKSLSNLPFSLSSCLIMAFFVYLCFLSALLCLCLCLLFFPSLFLFPRSPPPPSPFVVVVVYCRH